MYRNASIYQISSFLLIFNKKHYKNLENRLILFYFTLYKRKVKLHRIGQSKH